MVQIYIDVLYVSLYKYNILNKYVFYPILFAVSPLRTILSAPTKVAFIGMGLVFIL